MTIQEIRDFIDDNKKIKHIFMHKSGGQTFGKGDIGIFKGILDEAQAKGQPSDEAFKIEDLTDNLNPPPMMKSSVMRVVDDSFHLYFVPVKIFGGLDSLIYQNNGYNSNKK